MKKSQIKEVYRDLLSSKDKDFQNKGEQKQGAQTNNFYRLSGAGSDDKDKKPTTVKASFEGALSVGVEWEVLEIGEATVDLPTVALRLDF